MKKTITLFTSFGIMILSSSSIISCFSQEKRIDNDRQRQDDDRQREEDNWWVSSTVEKFSQIVNEEVELTRDDLNNEKLKSAIKILQKYKEAFDYNYGRVRLLKEELTLEKPVGTTLTTIENNDVVTVKGVAQEVENEDRQKPFTFTVKVKVISLEKKKVNDAVTKLQKLQGFRIDLTNDKLTVGSLKNEILNLNEYKDVFEDGITLKEGLLNLARLHTNVVLNNPSAGITDDENVIVSGTIQVGNIEKDFTFTVNVQEVFYIYNYY